MKSKNLGSKNGELKPGSGSQPLGCLTGSDESGDHQEQSFVMKDVKMSQDQLSRLGVASSLSRPIYQNLALDQDGDYSAAKYSRPKSSDHAGSSESPCHSSYSSHSSSCSASSPHPAVHHHHHNSPDSFQKLAHGDTYLGRCLKAEQEYENELGEDGETLNEPYEEDYESPGNRINNTTTSTVNLNDLSDSEDECDEDEQAGRLDNDEDDVDGSKREIDIRDDDKDGRGGGQEDEDAYSRAQSANENDADHDSNV